MAPYPQSVGAAQPATHVPETQCDPWGQPPAGQLAGGTLQACFSGSQYCPP